MNKIERNLRQTSEKLTTLISEIKAELNEVKNEIEEFKTDLNNILIEAGNRFDKLNKEVNKNTESFIQINTSVTDLILSNEELKRKIVILNLDKRVRVLENIVLHKAS